MPESRIENIILKNLIFNEDFSRKVLPYIKEEYFRQTHEKLIFRHVSEIISEYNKLPSISAIAVDIQKDNKVVEETYKEVLETLDSLGNDKTENDIKWLTDQAEEFCKEKAMANAAFKAVSILEGTDKKLDKGAIPGIFEEALSISFDPTIGQDYFLDAEQRYDNLHLEEYKIPFDVDFCNIATKGGVARKTLNLLAGGVYVGKTLGLCHLSKSYMCAGRNVLYITLEIDEDNVNLRVDCDLLDVSIDSIADIPKEIFLKKVEKKRLETPGKLVVKSYPATSVHVNNFRALLHELKLKKKFIPDVIMVDYLNLMCSCRIKPTEKTHLTIMAIAEELRALAQEYNVPVWSATQLDAEGMGSSDPSITNIAGSKVGLSATCDLLWMLVCSEKLRELGQMLVIQHKNRYKDASDHKKFYIGLDRKKFRWHDVEQKGQPTNDPLDDEEEIPTRQDISKKHGSQGYEPGYKNNKFGPRNSSKKLKFNDFHM